MTGAFRAQLPHLAPTLRRWQANILEPHPGPDARRPIRHTAYRRNGILIHASDPDNEQMIRSALGEALARRGWAAGDLASGIGLQPGSESVDPIDSWWLVAELRAHPNAAISAGVGLDHLMTTAEQLGGNPFALAHGQVGLDNYGAPGDGGRGPVSFVIPTPRYGRAGRRPRVVVLDTGIGDHPWFREHPAQTTVSLADGRTIGPTVDPASIKGLDADGRGAVADHLLGTLASHAGHGTFIAGLLRQACPDADIVALAVMGADGIVPESTLTDALKLIVQRQREQPGWADALVLSLGYYAESTEDLAYNTTLKRILLDIGRLGIAVFCAAGNDASAEPSYPAAFAIDPEFSADDVLPLVSVAALNPDGTVALFSNDGPWVTAEALGVNMVSTAPVDARGSGSGRSATFGPLGRPRAAVDPDAFSAGFAAWSGTSFAAPTLAAKYLRVLADNGFPPIAQRRRLVPVGRKRSIF